MAETAQLAVELKLGTTGSFKGATSEITAMEQAAMRGGGATSALTGGLGKAGKAASSFGGALGHAKGAIGGLLAGPLGLIGLGGGFLGLGLGLEQVISHTNDFAFSVEKLTALSGDTAEHMSGLLAVFQKFGVNAERTGMIVGFTEKTLGKLAETTVNKAGVATSKLITLQKEYGITLVGAKGHVADFQTTLLAVADVYQKHIDVSSKARLAALLFGRGYADLVPILALGRKGILDAEDAAKSLGLTLTSQNAKDLKQYRESLREASDAVGGLELQIGLALVPAIKDMADGITSFLEHGGRQGMVSFFKDAVTAGRNLASTIEHSVIPVIHGIADAWNSIPPEFRDLIVKGVVAEKAVKFLFGFSPASLVKDALGGAAGQFFQRGSPGNPMWVTSTGLPGGGGGGGIPTALKVLIPVAVVAAAIEASGILDPSHRTPTGQIFRGTNDQAQQLANQRASLAILAQRAAGGDTFAAKQLAETKAEIARLEGIATSTGAQAAMDARRVEAAENRTGLAVNQTGSLIAHHLNALNVVFRADLASLIAATKANDVAKFAKKIAAEIQHGTGSTASTKTVIATLRGKLAETHDPKLQAVLRHAIAQVEAKLPNRQLVDAQLAEARKTSGSTESAKRKLDELNAIQRTLRAHGDTNAAKQIDALKNVAKKVDDTKRQFSADARSETAGIRAAIQAQKLAVTIPVSVNNHISVAGVVHATTTFGLYGNKLLLKPR